MAGMTAEGTLYIEIVDLYVWLSQMGVDIDAPIPSITFDTAEECLWVHYDLTKTSVSDVDFWQWIHEKQLPSGLRGLESVFGVPKFGAVGLEITFAVSSEGHPTTWATPPACLKEWTNEAA